MENGESNIKMSYAEAVDKYTVMLLREEKGIPNDIERYEEFIPTIEEDLVRELYCINKKMWPMHEQIMAESDAEAGRISKELMRLNGVRTDVKFRIAKKYGGYKETKTYA